jgi:hypothetical protein
MQLRVLLTRARAKNKRVVHGGGGERGGEKERRRDETRTRAERTTQG